MRTRRILLVTILVIGIALTARWWLPPVLGLLSLNGDLIQAIDSGINLVSNLIAAISALAGYLLLRDQGNSSESLDQRNRRVMLDHVENFWVKGVLEKSLHGAALLELGIKEDPSKVSYPWAIKKETTNETLPTGKSMLEIFQEIGLGRSLLILGAPGSGKTTMLLELARQLIERVRKDTAEPIPVLFNLASWTEKQTLADWLTEQLNIFYYVPKKNASAWINENRMSLLLDGLDEVKGENRAKCVEAINRFRKEHGLTSLVVCSRIEEYSILKAKLLLEGAIKIQPLTPQQVTDYIDSLGNSLASIRQLLKKDNALQELAETPLMLSIIVLAYKDIKPEDLLASNSNENQRKRLFNTYIHRMFDRSGRSANVRFTKPDSLHYLSWLARMMIRHNMITYQIESMQPSWLVEQSQRHLYSVNCILLFGLLFGLSGGLFGGPLFGLLFGLSGGLLGGLLFGLLFGLSAGLLFGLSVEQINRIIMTDRLWSWEGRRGLFGGLLVGLLMGPFGGVLFEPFGRVPFGPFGGLLFGLFFGLLGGVLFGLIAEQVKETTFPGQRLKQSLFSGLFVTLIFGLFGWLSGGLIGALIGALIDRLFFGLLGGMFVGLLGGVLFGLFFGLSSGYLPLIQHYSLRWMLAQHRLLPRQLIAFLDYAVDLIFLRRVGGSYIFIHRLVMEHFAEMDA